MFPIYQTILTASLTVLGGAMLYVISQLITKLIVEPYTHYRDSLSDITYKIIVHSNHIHSARSGDDPDRDLIVSKEVRELSAKLRATITRVPFVQLLRWLHLLPSREDFSRACGLLIRISNSLREADKQYDRIFEDVSKVGELLRIDIGNR